MRARLIAGAAVAVSAGSLAAVTARGTAIPARVLHTSGPVVELAADGSRAAAIVGARRNGCDEVDGWDAASRRTVRMRLDSNCSADRGTGEGAYGIDVSGGRIAWVSYSGGNSRDSEVETATFAQPHPVWAYGSVTHDEAGGAYDGEYLGDVHGQGGLLVVSVWSFCSGLIDPCVAEGPQRAGGTVSGGALLRVGDAAPGFVPRRCADPSEPPLCGVLARGLTSIRVVAADMGHVVVAPPRGRLRVFAANGTFVAELPIDADSVEAARLAGGDLLVLRRGSSGPELDLYDAASGALRTRRTIAGPAKAADPCWLTPDCPPPPVSLEGLLGGVAVYVVGTTVHLLRLADGRERKIAVAAGGGPVHAQLTSAGLFTSFDDRRTRTGTIELVPLATVLARLG